MTAVLTDVPRLRYTLDTGLGRLSPAERVERGRKAREQVPRESHAEFVRQQGRPDPLSLLTAQAKSRVPDLVPIRWGRMMASPFSYYRGAALPMASDLAHTPATGLIGCADLRGPTAVVMGASAYGSSSAC